MVDARRRKKIIDKSARRRDLEVCQGLTDDHWSGRQVVVPSQSAKLTVALFNQFQPGFISKAPTARGDFDFLPRANASSPPRPTSSPGGGCREQSHLPVAQSPDLGRPHLKPISVIVELGEQAARAQLPQPEVLPENGLIGGLTSHQQSARDGSRPTAELSQKWVSAPASSISAACWNDKLPALRTHTTHHLELTPAAPTNCHHHDCAAPGCPRRPARWCPAPRPGPAPLRQPRDREPLRPRAPPRQGARRCHRW